MLLARRFLVCGRVQRIGFRAFVYDHAVHDGITGYARNLPDGGVEVMAEGEAEAMRRFEMALRQGPPGARVDHVEVDELSPTRRGGTFLIRG
jgi:acylphosphatase